MTISILKIKKNWNIPMQNIQIEIPLKTVNHVY